MSLFRRSRLARRRARLHDKERKWNLSLPGSRPWPDYVLDHPEYARYLRPTERSEDRDFLNAHPEFWDAV